MNKGHRANLGHKPVAEALKPPKNVLKAKYKLLIL